MNTSMVGHASATKGLCSCFNPNGVGNWYERNGLGPAAETSVGVKSNSLTSKDIVDALRNEKTAWRAGHEAVQWAAKRRGV